MKIITVGCGKAGSSLAEQLYMEGHETTLIDRDADVFGAITNSIDVMGMAGNGAVYKVQMEAGIEDTDLLIATTNPGELNMLCCLITRKAGNCQTIARVRNPEYTGEIRYIREESNPSMAVNPELTAAREMSRLLRLPSIIRVDTFAKGWVEILKFIIPEHSVLHNIQVYEVTPKLRCNVLICAVECGKDVITPNNSFQMTGGDRVYFVAPLVESMKFFREVGIVNNNIKTAMFVGGGRITYYLAKMFQDIPIQIKIIEQDFKRCKVLSKELPNVMVIYGGGSNQQVLLEEGIRQMGAFVSLTGSDEEDIMSSLYAASQPKTKLIAKVNRITLESVIESMNLGSTIYPKLIAADSILQYIRAMQNSPGNNVETPYKIVANRAEVLEFRVEKNASMIGVPLGKLSLKDNPLVACINRNGKITTPRSRDTIEEYDTVIIVTTNTGLNDLKDILK